MALTLDPQTEQRIQRELEHGPHTEPAEVINHALDLLEAQESWSDEEKSELDASLDRAASQLQRGEGIPCDKIREHLAHRQNARLR